MAVLIDASVLIAFERGGLDLESNVARRAEEEFFLSVVTASELLHGVRRATAAKVRARRSAYVEAVIERFPVLDVDLTIARAHALLWADLAAKGHVVGPHDLWLAATCIAHGMSIATSNVRKFRRVPGLNVEEWKAAR